MDSTINQNGAVCVRRFGIIGTRTVVYSAGVYLGKRPDWTRFSTIHSDNDGRYFGQIGTERLPAELDAMPRGPERVAAVTKWFGRRYYLAGRCIRFAFGETIARGEFDMGGASVILTDGETLVDANVWLPAHFAQVD